VRPTPFLTCFFKAKIKFNKIPKEINAEEIDNESVEPYFF
jgi:hypothetical protein